MQLLRKLRKALEVYFPTASPQEKVDLTVLPTKSSDMKELRRKSVFSQGKGILVTFYKNVYTL